MTATKHAKKGTTHEEQPLRHENGTDVKGSIRAAEVVTDESKANEGKPVEDSGINTISTDTIITEPVEYPLPGKLEDEPLRIHPSATDVPMHETYFVEAPPSHPANGQHLRIDLKIEGVKSRYNELLGSNTVEVGKDADFKEKTANEREVEAQKRALEALAEEKLAEGRGDSAADKTYRAAALK